MSKINYLGDTCNLLSKTTGDNQSASKINISQSKQQSSTVTQGKRNANDAGLA